MKRLIALHKWRKRRVRWLVGATVVASLLLAGCDGVDSDGTSLPTQLLLESSTLQPTPSLTLVMSATNTPSPVPSITPSRTPTLLPNITPSATPTKVPSPTRTAIATITATPLPQLTPQLVEHPRQIRLALEVVASGLDRPTSITDAGDVAGRLYVTEKAGRIRIVQNGIVLPDPFLDIEQRTNSNGSEDGMLGLAFHPDYLTNGLFFVFYTNSSGQNVLSRFNLTPDRSRADAGSEQIILALGQPTPEHNGGRITFGPDGYLYVPVGDGGGIGDEFNNGQNTSTLLASVLRLDVTPAGGLFYSVPPDNPFVGVSGVRDEIWSYGLRNPWGFSFDRATGDVYIADVGELGWEEVDFLPAGVSGLNFGWPMLEGNHCYSTDQICQFPGTIPPIVELRRDLAGCAIIGGYVYRGTQFPVMQGTYLFGDFCRGRMWGLRRQPNDTWQFADLFSSSLRISAFGEDRAGELYVVDFSLGILYHIGATRIE